MRPVSALHVLEYLRDDQGVWILPVSAVDRLRASHPTVRFSSAESRETADRLIPEADIVLGWAVRPKNFAAARRLKWIHVSAAGVGPLLFPELVASDVVLTNGRGMHSVAMAEHTIGVILAFVRKLHLARDAQRDRTWIPDALWRSDPPIGELAGTTMGLVGLGSVGSAIAVRARALGMRVLAVRRHPSADPAPADAQWGLDRLDELMTAADWLVLAPPLTADTRGMIDARRLARMKPSAVLINIGRGALVEEPALIAALESRSIAGAALDVFEHEPLPAESPLWAMPQVIVTPHVSGLGPRYWERAMELFERNLDAYLAGRPLENVVDKRAGY